MARYLFNRLAQAVVVLFLVTVIVFILLHLLPGDPAHTVIGPRATPIQIQTFNRENGLDQPLYRQYLHNLWCWLRGDFGFSYQLNQSVQSLLIQRLPKTVILGVLGIIFTLLIAVPMGIYQAVKRNSWFDYTATALSFIFYAAPSFFIGLLIIYVFSQKLNLLPPEAPQSDGIKVIFTQFQSMLLPVVTISLVTIASFSRYMRSAVIDTQTQDYIRTARAKGLSETKILTGHVLRNTLIPIVTLIGTNIPLIFSGALITESLFNYPGMGLLVWQAAQTHDYPIELGVVIVTATATILGNLITDIITSLIDPRIRL